MSLAHASHQDARTTRLRAAFRQVRGAAGERARARAIARLPRVRWKDKRLCTMRCRADFGSGPHLVHVPEAVLWSLIDLRQFRCPWHR